MKPVPMTPTPISRIPFQSAFKSNLDGSTGQGRLERAVGQTQRLAAVMRGRWHRRTAFERDDERIEFRLVGVGISLQEEIQQWFAHVRCGPAPTPNGGR